jgi:hypothetical protein
MELDKLHHLQLLARAALFLSHFRDTLDSLHHISSAIARFPYSRDSGSLASFPIQMDASRPAQVL